MADWPLGNTPANTRVIAQTLRGASTDFDDLTVVSREPDIDLASEYPLSSRTDIHTAGVSRIAAESVYRIRANASTESLESVKFLRYVAGYKAEVGIAIHIPTAPTGDQEVRWGYWDGDDGVYWGYDSTGVFVEQMRGGTRQGKIREADWNAPEFENLDAESQLQDGVVTRIGLLLYNFGNVEFEMFARDSETRQIDPTTVHRVGGAGETTLSQQNNPIRVEVDNPAAEDFDVFVADRQAALRGEFTSSARTNGGLVTGISLSGTDWVHLASVRRKSGFEAVDINLLSLGVLPADDIILQLRSDASLTGTAYSSPQFVDASETGVEVDTSATLDSVTSGNFRFIQLAAGAQGEQTAFGSLGDVETSFNRLRPISLLARRVSGTGGSIDAVTVSWTEEW